MRFFELFHSRSRSMPYIGPVEVWPKGWVTVLRKEYSALPKIFLPKIEETTALAKQLQTRISSRDFSGGLISLKSLSQLLHDALGIFPYKDAQGEYPHHRAFPSAGGRYPLEVYIFALKIDAIDPGLYHYDAEKNALTFLREGFRPATRLFELSGYSWVSNASALIFFSGVFDRTVSKYGERGYRLVLLEAGHAGQCVYLAAKELGIKCCALALKDESVANELFQLDGVSESVVHTIAVGV